jgi:hypothetical protein
LRREIASFGIRGASVAHSLGDGHAHVMCLVL